MEAAELLTAKQRHRRDVFARYGSRPTCELAGRHRCCGPLQADHILEVRWLVAERSNVRILFGPKHPLAVAALDDVIADARNGWILCEGANALKFSRMLRPPLVRDDLPPHVEDFALDYRIEHLLDRYFGT